MSDPLVGRIVGRATEKIDAAYAAEKRQKPRTYIGASNIGNSCDALLSLSLRGFPETPPPPNLQRIFALGYVIEDIVVADLKRIKDIDVLEADPITGRQFEKKDFGGHVSMHADGMVQAGDKMGLLEIKSMNDASWSKFNKSGVRVSHPSYYSQIQFEMGYWRLPVALFIAYNKNRSIYMDEWVPYDDDHFQLLSAKAERLVKDNHMAERCSVDQTDWRCKGCFKREACWEEIEVEQVIEPKCRHCRFASPTTDGKWYCDKLNTPAEKVCLEWVQYVPKTRT